jgi:hypothetical protein
MFFESEQLRWTHPSQVALILSLLSPIPHVGFCSASWASMSSGGVGSENKEKPFVDTHKFQVRWTLARLPTCRTSLQLSVMGLKNIVLKIRGLRRSFGARAYFHDGHGLMKQPLPWCAGGAASFCGGAAEGGMETVTAAGMEISCDDLVLRIVAYNLLISVGRYDSCTTRHCLIGPSARSFDTFLTRHYANMRPPTGEIGDLDWYSDLRHPLAFMQGTFKRIGKSEHFQRASYLGDGEEVRIMLLLYLIIGHRLSTNRINQLLSTIVEDALNYGAPESH